MREGLILPSFQSVAHLLHASSSPSLEYAIVSHQPK